jgi:hypothetical protein
MVKNRVKEIIFKKLYHDLSKCEIISYIDSIWVINREKKYWYLRLNKCGELWWRYDFFDHFFFMFCLKLDEYEPIICEWAEEVLNFKVDESVNQLTSFHGFVDEVIDYKVIMPTNRVLPPSSKVEEVLNYEVSTSHYMNTSKIITVNEVLNSYVPKPSITDCHKLVEDVLKHKSEHATENSDGGIR